MPATDSSGAVVSSASYDSFGNSTNNLTTRYQYTGREFDNFTGLYFYRARWYDANLGRFVSEDPIGFRGKDVNLYGYVWNNPVKLIDPQGTDGGASLVLGGGAAIGAGGAIGVAATGAGIGIGIGAIWYGAWQLGEWIAEQPWNPLTHPQIPPFPNQADSLPKTNTPPFAKPGDSCDAKPRAIPRRSNPRPDRTPDRDGCAEEISACVQLCSEAEFDPNMKHIWGGSRTACLKGCISERCQRGFRF